MTTPKSVTFDLSGDSSTFYAAIYFSNTGATIQEVSPDQDYLKSLYHSSRHVIISLTRPEALQVATTLPSVPLPPSVISKIRVAFDVFKATIKAINP